MPLRHLLLEPREEARQLGVREDPLGRALAQGAGELFFPGHVPPLEQARRRGQIGARALEQIVDGDDLMPDRDPHVPERIEQRIGDGRSLVDALREQANVEVALERHRAAPVAADPGEGHGVPGVGPDRRSVGDGELAAAQGAEERGQEIVEDARVAAAEGEAARFEGAKRASVSEPATGMLSRSSARRRAKAARRSWRENGGGVEERPCAPPGSTTAGATPSGARRKNARRPRKVVSRADVRG